MSDLVDAQMELSTAGREDLAIILHDEIERKDAAIAELVAVLKRLHDQCDEYDISLLDERNAARAVVAKYDKKDEA